MNLQNPRQGQKRTSRERRRRRRRQRLMNRLKFAVAMSVLLLTVFTVYGAVTNQANPKPKTLPTPAPEITAGQPDIGVDLNGVELTEANIYFADINSYLELVNIDYSVNSDLAYVSASAYTVIPVSRSAMELNPVALDALDRLFDEAAASGYTKFVLTSGKRTYDDQKKIYDESADKSFVQVPNHSEHQTGFAADIFYQGIGESAMAQSAEGKWLKDNAWKFGFILRYPEDKVEITKISFEPWHFRYIGLPHAYYCYVNNLCFEEYIQFLKDNNGYSVEINGTTYCVYYQTPDNGIIQVPSESEGGYEISRDNTGGFIITLKDS